MSDMLGSEAVAKILALEVKMQSMEQLEMRIKALEDRVSWMEGYMQGLWSRLNEQGSKITQVIDMLEKFSDALRKVAKP